MTEAELKEAVAQVVDNRSLTLEYKLKAIHTLYLQADTHLCLY
jgi:hypothetical protein